MGLFFGEIALMTCKSHELSNPLEKLWQRNGVQRAIALLASALWISPEARCTSLDTRLHL